MDRAYSLITIKAIDQGRRRIVGTATTPTPDRAGDILEPLGATFAAEIPLLLHHRKDAPVGVARLQTPTADGIDFEAEIPTIDEPGPVKDEVDRAWVSITSVPPLIRGTSVGFRPRGKFDEAIDLLKGGGLRFKKTEILELSLVTVPANAEATLSVVKDCDAPYLAATGRTPPRAGGPLPIVRAEKAARPMTTAEQITAFEATRATKAARMTALMQKAADAGVTLDQAETEEYDGLELEVKSIDAHLVRLRALEKTMAASATPITAKNAADASAQRGGQTTPVIQVKSQVPPGTAFVRTAMCLLRAKGDSYRALDFARQYKESTPEVELMIKAAVAPGDTVTPSWAGVLVQIQNATDEFLALLRPATIIGKIPNLRQVPFNTQVPLQTGGGTYGWVGQGKLKPVGKLALTTAAIQFSKAAGIIVITEELAKLSTPSAEAVVRADMIAGISAFLDSQFIDPAVAMVANVSPASITNGAATAASSDNASQDLATILSAFSTANIPLSGVTLIMSEKNALAMGMKRDAMGNKLFPSMGVAGGTAEGINVVASNAAGTNVIGLSGPNILFADEGGIAIDVSREASVLMDSAPPAAPDATAVYTSLWQANLVGLRAERMINWLRARPEAVFYLTDAAYTV